LSTGWQLDIEQQQQQQQQQPQYQNSNIKNFTAIIFIRQLADTVIKDWRISCSSVLLTEHPLLMTISYPDMI